MTTKTKETAVAKSILEQCSKFQPSLANIMTLLAAREPLIWVITQEEQRATEDIMEACGSIYSQTSPGKLLIHPQFYSWDGLTGLLPMVSKNNSWFLPGNIIPEIKAKFQKTQKVSDAVERFKNEMVQSSNNAANPHNASVLFMYDLHSMMEPQLERFLRNWRYEASSNDRTMMKGTIIIVSPEFGRGTNASRIPTTLAADTPVVFYDLPGIAQAKGAVTDLINLFTEQVEAKNKTLPEDQPKIVAPQYNEVEILELSRALCGLTLPEIKRSLKYVAVQRATSKLTPESLLTEKKKILKRDGILEPIDPKVDMSHVGGLDLLKQYFTVFSHAFSEDANKFGVKPPKGILVAGVPGSGKSLVAKALGLTYSQPILRLDIGVLFNSLVGSSEARTREALKQAEAFGTCILWIDEIEKGLSGTQSSGQTDGGTTARVFSTILTWMQEREAGVTVLATANDVTALPPELLRRFNEIFFVDLPTRREREEILKILLSKVNRDLKNFDKEALLDNSDKFTGAELEKAILEGLAQAYADKMAKKSKDLTTEHLVNAFRATRPIAVVQPEKIQRIRDWARTRARFASSEALEANSGRRSVPKDGQATEVEVDALLT